MNIALVGEFVDKSRAMLKKVAGKRGHKVVQSPDRAVIVFMVAYPRQLSLVKEAKKRNGFVVVLVSGVPKVGNSRAFFKEGAYDFIAFPCSEDGMHEMFAQLEGEMQEIFGE